MISLISRESPLAQVQVEELQALLPEIEFSPLFVKSGGDVDLKSSLMSGEVPANFFTDILDKALLSGEVECSVNSAKDLPFPLPKGIVLSALTEAKDQSDSLVSKNGETLLTLPVGAKVGTSSISRKKQLLDLRPDLDIVSIRGSIEQRLEYINRDEVTSVIVATCALDRLGLSDRISERLPFETHDLQGNLALLVREDNYRLLALFSSIDSRKKYGSVTLVGAGPGDPDLITKRGEKAIASADIIFYDALINEELLEGVTGELVFVGKRKGEHYLSQDEINRLLYKASKEGKNVVRLKCGDPLLFSRGGEEITYLQERFVEVSVVPGVSSFQGCASSLTMPLTQRGISRSLTALSAHYEKPADIPVTESGTQVIFMGVTKAEEIQTALRGKGWSEDTPIRVISRGTFGDEQIFSTTVTELHTVDAPAPAMIIVGGVTEAIQSEPKILFTGLDASRVGVRGKIIHQPLIKLSKKELTEEFVPHIEEYSGFIFTSRAGVEFFLESWDIPQGAKVVAIGPHTAKELEDRGVKVDAIPEKFDSTHLTTLIEKSDTENWLYPCSSRSKNPLHSLENVTIFSFYETQLREVEPLDLQTFSAVFFSSPSTVDSFIVNYKEIPSELSLLVYGEPSVKKLESVGISRDQIVIWPILPVRELS